MTAEFLTPRWEMEEELADLKAELAALKKGKKNIKHSKGDPNWCTPFEFVEYNRLVMGRIGFDPFSSQVANGLQVHAAKFLTPAEDGFTAPWEDYAHINPPGLLIKKAWDKLCAEVVVGRVTKAMWIGFSVEQLCVLADPNLKKEPDSARWARGAFHPMDFSVVILRKRISFVREDGTEGSPSHGNYICGIGVNHEKFLEIYGPLGRVVEGPLADYKRPCDYPACRHDEGLCFSNYEIG